MSTYQPPVDRLLALGRPNEETWDDYSRFGIGPEHVPELLRMMLDMDLRLTDGESATAYAPIHAWRAVSQWKPPAAASTYLTMLAQVSIIEDYCSDWEIEEAKDFFLRLGPETIPELADFLDDHQDGEYPRWTIADVLAALAQAHPETRSAVVAILARQLERPEFQETVNAAVIGALADLKATETAGLIESAFREGKVAEEIYGDWPYIGHRLGLLPKPTARENRSLAHEFALGSSADRRPDNAKTKAKAKRKMARASRKRNRRR